MGTVSSDDAPSLEEREDYTWSSGEMSRLHVLSLRDLRHIEEDFLDWEDHHTHSLPTMDHSRKQP